jgi:hypothetical protein
MEAFYNKKEEEKAAAKKADREERRAKYDQILFPSALRAVYWSIRWRNIFSARERALV